MINVNLKATVLYLALTVEKDILILDGLAYLVPKRALCRGRQPRVHTKALAYLVSRYE